MGQKPGSSWPGWWGFGVSHDFTNKVWLGLEDLPLRSFTQGFGWRPEMLIITDLFTRCSLTAWQQNRSQCLPRPPVTGTSCGLHRWILAMWEGGYTQVWKPGSGAHWHHHRAGIQPVFNLLYLFPCRPTHLNFVHSAKPPSPAYYTILPPSPPPPWILLQRDTDDYLLSLDIFLWL